MMKKLLLFVALCCSIGKIHAQNGTVVSGGDASGSGGKVSFTVGQTNYITETGSNGVVTQGMQQPYEIMIISGLDKTSINMTASVYPNPTEGYIILNIDNEDVRNLNYTLFDVAGNTIRQKKVYSKQTQIPLSDLAEGVYFIKVLRGESEMKTFKIIKNK